VAVAYLIATLTFKTSHPAHTVLVFGLTVTTIDRHASEHHLTIFFVMGKTLCMRKTTNHYT